MPYQNITALLASPHKAWFGSKVICMENRRRFLQSVAATAATSLAVPRWLLAQTAAGSPAALRRTSAPAVPLPANFTGLGYEMSSVARGDLLAPSNEAYLRLVKNLGPSGVLRIGGIVADFSTYAPDGTAAANPTATIVTRGAIENFAAFLRATGWRAIWSVNFGRGTLENAVLEAKDVARLLGPSLLAFEIGNEVENYGKVTPPPRPKPYTYEQYRDEYTKWRQAILAAVPGASFAAPDTGNVLEWVEQMAHDAHGDVQLLTTHYYRGAQGKATPEQLAVPDPRLDDITSRLRAASLASHIPWRICETNSFFGGGHPGISDTLLGALWTLDYMLLLAQAGCAGVNIETGINQLGFVSSYSPIQHDGQGHNTAGVPYYAMLAFRLATEHATQILPVAVEGANPGFTAYLLNGADQKSCVAINRDATKSITLSLAVLGLTAAQIDRLTGPSLLSKRGVSFAGAEVAADGTWKPNTHEGTVDGKVTIPPMSAAVVRTPRTMKAVKAS